MADTLELLMDSGVGISTLLLALSGALFILYLLTIVALIGWQKVRGR
jgi:hypothetical protein